MSFDILAPHYRWMEWLLAGRKLQRCRTAFLDEVRHAREVLLLGEGNGRFLSAFAKANRNASITVLDASAGMLRHARRRTGGAWDHRICYIQADVLGWSPPRHAYDLIVTNFFFDCFRPDQLASLVPALAAGATPDARWIVSDFRVPSAGLARWRALWIVRSMYYFFRIVTRLPARTITPIDSFLSASGFGLHARRISEWGLLHSDLWRRQAIETPL
jgi:SAM-dependent methyltransferase